MKVILRRATEADAKHAASLLTELGYPSTEADARDRLVRSLRSATSYCLVAELAAEVVGLISAELVFYFPTGSTICRITSLVVSSQHRGHGLGQKLLTAAIGFAREHHCSGLELTSAEGRHFFGHGVFSPDGKLLATGSADSQVKLWEAATGREVRTLKGHAEEVQCVRFSPDGTTLATCSGKTGRISGDNSVVPATY